MGHSELKKCRLNWCSLTLRTRRVSVSRLARGVAAALVERRCHQPPPERHGLRGSEGGVKRWKNVLLIHVLNAIRPG